LSFDRFADPSCQRGLTFVYRLHHPVELEVFAQAIGLAAQRSQQTWGDRVVDIWIVPRRFECQFGVRSQEIRFMHRFSANAAQRVADKEAFEAALNKALN
tara:strand:- start:202 stop:501 length:300 start_codon:yes stop_codon:yes gene_type:complete